MTASLTTRQLEILAFIRERHATSGVPPSIREIGDEFGIRSTNGVSDHLKALVRKGAVRKLEGQARGYVPTPRAGAAGMPWDECLVRYDLTDARPLAAELELAGVRGGAGLPAAWRLVGVDGSDAADAAVFSVAGTPRAEDGLVVLAWLRERRAV